MWKDPIGTAIQVSRLNGVYITQVSDEITGWVTKKLSQEFSGTESQFMVALSKIVKAFLMPQVRVQYRTVPGISRNPNIENQEPTDYHCQNDSLREVDASI